MDAAVRPPRTELTHDQWGDLDDDEDGELVDGILVEEEIPSIAHEVVVSWLLRVLGAWLVPRGGVVLASEA